MAKRLFSNFQSRIGRNQNDINVITNRSVDESELFERVKPINAHEALFLEAVRDGNMKQVQRFISEGHIDINCSDYTGETALQIAVYNEMPDIANLLMKNGAELGNALFQAISRDSVDCVEILIDYYEKKPQVSRIFHASDQQPLDGHEKHFNVTPIVLAAQKGNYEIVKMLLLRGHRVAKPHSKFCEIRNCTQMECQGREKRLENALMRLNSYQALASPVYLCLSYLIRSTEAKHSKDDDSHDPIYKAIVLKKELEELAYEDYEYRSEYQELSRECEEFAVRLLSKCRTLDESASVMDLPDIIEIKGVAVRNSERQYLNVINFAIKNRNKKFVAHPISQLMLNAVLYKGIQGWENKSVFITAPLLLIYALLLPLFSIIYLFTPRNFLTAKMEVPPIKFVSHVASFCWFMALIIMSAFQDKFASFLQLSVLDVLVGLWVLGLLVEEIKQGFRQGVERYFTQWWHLATILMVICYIFAGLLWLIGFWLSAKDGLLASLAERFAHDKRSDTSLRFILLSNAFYALGLVLTFFQASHTFQVSSLLGPLQLSLMNMIRDCLKFLILFSFNFVAFALAMRKLYSQFIEILAFEQKMYGNNGTSVTHAFKGEISSFRWMFWALFDKTDLDAFKTADDRFAITATTGEILFAGYNIAAVIVALNMLIAMLSNTFQKIADDQDVTFKFIRTRIWMQYVNEGSVLTPPFNLIPTNLLGALVRRGIRFCCCVSGRCEDRCARCFDWSYVTTAESKKMAFNATKRKEVFKNLIRRHFFELDETKGAETAAEESEAKMEKKLESLTHTVAELKEAICRLSRGTSRVQEREERSSPEQKDQKEDEKDNQRTGNGAAYGWKL